MASVGIFELHAHNHKEKVCEGLQAIHGTYLSHEPFTRVWLQSLQISDDELSCRYIGIIF